MPVECGHQQRARAGVAIADNYILKYQFADDFFQGNLVGVQPLMIYKE